MKTNDRLFLKEVTLSGYKSINEVYIDLKDGLNIIIGKNAAGKTNFLNFLNTILSLKYDSLNNFTSKLIFYNGKEISLESSKYITSDDILKEHSLNPTVNNKLKISGKTIKGKESNEGESIQKKLIENNILFNNTLLCHGIPKEYLIVDKPFSFKIQKDIIKSNELISNIRDSFTPYFVRRILLNIFINGVKSEKVKDFDLTIIKNDLNSVFEKVETIRLKLKKYSPIEDLRFSKNYNIFLSDDKEDFILNNLFIEFKIDGNWLPFNNLSDGTKRLFYIISETVEFEDEVIARPTNTGSFRDKELVSRIILIEEPELGIHPHQFHKLMEFLKEESEDKQILITTHSPQALDALKEDELDRIIITYSTNPKEGTKLRHLNKNELLKAHVYIKEDFLSDYWLYSDLEK